MIKIKLTGLEQYNNLKKTFIESIGIIGKGSHVFFLGVYNQYPETREAIAWFYQGTRMYKYALKNNLKGQKLYLNFTQDPETIIDVFYHKTKKHLVCQDDLCYLDTSYLVIPSIISVIEKEKERIKLFLKLNDDAWVKEENIPITNRYSGCLIEALIHLSRIEYYCSNKEKTIELYRKLLDCLETMKKVSGKTHYHSIVKEIMDRAEKCL